MQQIVHSPRLTAIEEKWRTPVHQLFYHWHWDENLKHSEIGKKVGLPRGTVTRWFHKLHIPSQSCTRFTNLNLLNTGPRKGPRAKPKVKREFPWKVNQSFFETWSEEMAYVLGFFVADGNLTVNPRGSKYIEFTSCDRAIIEKIRDALGSNHSIGVKPHERDRTRRAKDCYRLQIGSKKLFKNLSAFGMIVRKSLIVQLPAVPHKFFCHFLRGYFDGCGHVVIYEYFRKGRRKKNRVLASGFTSGGKKILEQIFLVLKKYRVVAGGSISEGDGFNLRFSIHDSRRLYTYMYSSMKSELFLPRKKVVFEKF